MKDELNDEYFEEEEDDEDEETSSENGYEDNEDETEEILPKSGKNIGKTLRKLDYEDNGEVLKKSGLFKDSEQLPLGVQTKRIRFEEEDYDFSENEGEEKEIRDDEEESSGPLLVKTSTIQTDPSHVRTQRRNEADILGIRIRLQTALTLFTKLGEKNYSTLIDVQPLYELLEKLIKIRYLLIENGMKQYYQLSSSSLLDKNEATNKVNENIWKEILTQDDELWEQHRPVIEAWERRAHLSMNKGKALRAMNKSAMDQTEAAIARRSEITQQQQQKPTLGNEHSRATSFLKDDESFYQQLLRDFVQSRSNNLYETVNSTKEKRKKKYSKVPKDERINYQVHEKLVNFIAPTSLPAPTIDVDQLVKSLFQ